MKNFLLLFTLSGISLLSFSLAHGLVMPMTTQEVLDEFEIILLGTITDVQQSQGTTPVYTIQMENMVKSPDSFREARVISGKGCNPNTGHIGTPCPSYEVGDHGLFLLVPSKDDYEISFYSQVAKPNCTAEQFLANYRGMASGITLRQDGQSEVFFTQKAMDMQYLVNNREMTLKEYSVTLTAYSDKFDFSEVQNGTVSECSGFEIVSTSFVPTEMGTYGFSVTSDDSGENFFGLSIIDYGSSPLKQFKARIHGQDTWCKDGLILVLKKDKTENLIFDNKPACVKPQTVSKLLQRDVIESSSFYHNRPLIERLYMGMAILQVSDFPIAKLEFDEQEKILRVQINEDELDKTPDAKDYFDRVIREKILFNVPMEITFGR